MAGSSSVFFVTYTNESGVNVVERRSTTDGSLQASAVIPIGNSGQQYYGACGTSGGEQFIFDYDNGQIIAFNPALGGWRSCDISSILDSGESFIGNPPQSMSLISSSSVMLFAIQIEFLIECVAPEIDVSSSVGSLVQAYSVPATESFGGGTANPSPADLVYFAAAGWVVYSLDLTTNVLNTFFEGIAATGINSVIYAPGSGPSNGDVFISNETELWLVEETGGSSSASSLRPYQSGGWDGAHFWTNDAYGVLYQVEHTTTTLTVDLSISAHIPISWVPVFSAIVPPTRQKPRDDNLALGATRRPGTRGNAPKSVQHSYRRGTRGTYH